MIENNTKVVSSEYVLNYPPWMVVRKDMIGMPSRSSTYPYYTIELPEWVNVIPVTSNQTVILIRQYRHALGREHFELPGGIVEPKETVLDAAKRELKEETGFGGGEWQLHLICSPNPALQNNLVHSFVARNVCLIAEQSLDLTEQLEVCEISISKVKEYALAGKIIQSLHLSALFKYFLLNKI